jgi:hypothetical protein
MEQFEARIERLEYSPKDIFLLEIVVSPIPKRAPGRGKPIHYTIELDPGAPGGPTMTPKGELQDCFDVYHRYEYDDGLNPKLRRQWHTACLADQIVHCLFNSGALREIRLVRSADD